MKKDNRRRNRPIAPEDDSGDDTDSSNESDSNSDDGMGDENNIYADNNIPEHVRKADTLFHVTRLSALTADADEAEDIPPPTLASPSLKNILNPPSSHASRPEDVIDLVPILTIVSKKIDYQAMIRLRQSHDAQPRVISERSYTLKNKYSEYEPRRTADLAQRLANSGTASSLTDLEFQSSEGLDKDERPRK